MDRLARAEQVALEARLAQMLLDAEPGQRADLYGAVYDRIFESSLRHRGTSPVDQTFGASPRLVPFLESLTRPGDEVLEVGCGCGYLALELAARGREVVGVDVSQVAIDVANEHARTLQDGARISFRTISGSNFPFPEGKFDFVFSVEVLEHLHEDDVVSHLRECRRVLKEEGLLWVLTPNRLSARTLHERWDVDHESHGQTAEDRPDVHLRIWTYREIDDVLRQAGLQSAWTPWGHSRRRVVRVPVGWKGAAEWLAERLPELARNPFMRQAGVNSVSIVARTSPLRLQDSRT